MDVPAAGAGQAMLRVMTEGRVGSKGQGTMTKAPQLATMSWSLCWSCWLCFRALCVFLAVVFRDGHLFRQWCCCPIRTAPSQGGVTRRCVSQRWSGVRPI